MSFAETATNVAVGYVIAIVTQAVLFPLLDLEVGRSEHIVIAGTFTMVSLVRGFLLRRLFERLRVRRSGSETAANMGGGSAAGLGEAQSTMR